MKIDISGKHLDTGGSLQSHVEEHLTHVVDKYFGKALEAHVTVSKETHIFHTMIRVHVGHGIYIRGEGKADEPYPSVDQAIHVIENNLRRYKNRLKDHHKRGDQNKRSGATHYIVGKEYLNHGAQEEPDMADVPAVVAESVGDLPTITVSEAIMRMDLEGQNVLLFTNKATGHLNVVHMRPDGYIGWIDPMPS